MTITQINIYPVKSLDGYSPESAVLTARGFQYDRRWMLVDENNVFMTQRQFGKMALLRATVVADKLRISKKEAPNDFIEIPLSNSVGTGQAEVQIWEDLYVGAGVSVAADRWLSEALDKSCRLVFMSETTNRVVDPVYNTGGDIVSFADAYPYLLIGEASLQDLNSRLKTPVSMRRFRPNIVFSGAEPYYEERMRNFSIGNNDFLGVKPCGRCVLTTRDPDTGIKGAEPLKTLASYRQFNNKILFGQNLVWKPTHEKQSVESTIKVGDLIVLR